MQSYDTIGFVTYAFEATKVISNKHYHFIPFSDKAKSYCTMQGLNYISLSNKYCISAVE